MKLIDVIRDKEKTASLIHIRDGVAEYRVEVDGKPYMFPIPLAEMNSGVFLLEDKIRIFQRWIGKALESNNFMPLF
jgi:hypothetical protein